MYTNLCLNMFRRQHRAGCGLHVVEPLGTRDVCQCTAFALCSTETMDDWDVAAPNSPAASESDERPTRGRGSGKSSCAKRAKAKAKAKAKGRGRKKGAGDEEADGDPDCLQNSSAKDECFCTDCTAKKLQNSKFCRVHHRPYENMKYQATRDDELRAFNEVMMNPGKATVAIKNFMRDNPAGATRKRFIDWAMFKREHGVRLSYTIREGEILLDIDDFWVQKGKPKGWTRDQSDGFFRDMAQSGRYEREGEGVDLKLWVTKNKERMRDRTHYSDCAFVEGSKQLKDVDRSEKDEMLSITKSSVSDFNANYLRSVAGTGGFTSQELEAKAKADEAANEKVEPLPKKTKVANVSDEAPRVYGKVKKELPVLEKTLRDSIAKLEKAWTRVAH